MFTYKIKKYCSKITESHDIEKINLYGCKLSSYVKGGTIRCDSLIKAISNNIRELFYAVQGTYNSFEDLLFLTRTCRWHTPEDKEEVMKYVSLHKTYFDDLIERSRLLKSFANQAECYTDTSKEFAIEIQTKANKIVEFIDLIVKNIETCDSVKTFMSYSYPQIVLFKVYAARLVNLIPNPPVLHAAILKEPVLHAAILKEPVLHAAILKEPVPYATIP
jgi:hypothetical protein